MAAANVQGFQRDATTGALLTQADATVGGATPKFVKGSVAASQTDSALVAAVTGKKIRVLSLVIQTGPTTPSSSTFTSKPGGAGTAVSAALLPPASTCLPLAYSPAGHFETVSGEGLSVTTGAGSTTLYQLTYIEV